jgi:hypothetical protein
MMKKALKISLLVIGTLGVFPILVLRVTGLEPRFIAPESQAYADSGRTAGPGLWLKGEVVREPVKNWDWVREVNHPVREHYIMMETNTWYGIPHSVTVRLNPRGDKLYLVGTAQGARLDKEFPDGKAWWKNVMRDPRVRMKIDGKIYEMTLVLINNRDEIAELTGRYPIRKRIGPDGNEQVVVEGHWFRVYQRNVPEYGSELTAVSSSE